MRTIKFRGKRKDNGEWAYGNYYSDGWMCSGIRGEAHFIKPFVGEKHEVEYTTVGQFTGLHDKNGKEVYDSDIIAINWKVPTEKCYAEILWSEDEHGWNYVSEGCIRPGNPLLELVEEKVEFEVIGNIHEDEL